MINGHYLDQFVSTAGITTSSAIPYRHPQCEADTSRMSP
jgi:hypothetical protein